MATIIAISSVDPGSTWYLSKQTESDLGVLEANQGVIIVGHDCGENKTSVKLEGDISGCIYCIPADTLVTRNPHWNA